MVITEESDINLHAKGCSESNECREANSQSLSKSSMQGTKFRSMKRRWTKYMAFLKSSEGRIRIQKNNNTGGGNS